MVFSAHPPRIYNIISFELFLLFVLFSAYQIPFDAETSLQVHEETLMNGKGAASHSNTRDNHVHEEVLHKYCSLIAKRVTLGPPTE